VSGYFDSRQNIWQEPLDRNVFGLLEQFGDAELASLIAPRSLIVEASSGPEATIPGGRGAPARLVTPTLETVRSERDRAKALVAKLNPAPVLKLVETESGNGKCGGETALTAFLNSVAESTTLSPPGKLPENLLGDFKPDLRHARQMYELDRHSQQLLRESHYVRQTNTMGKFDFSALDAFEQSADAAREFFYDEVIGKFDRPMLPPNVRSRQFKETEKWIGYEVVLDVFPDVIAYGLLLVPKDLDAGERRPVVVCQHGLEGRPQDTIGEQGSRYYSAFAAKLAERGFITFAPQNLYIFTDRFRTLQRKCNPLKKTLFSVITPQHQQIVDWLQGLDFVDPDRIAFYGLSYGGKTAMRVPALVTDYCLSICSADFNEWVDKNASTRNPRSYVNTGEYEIFEFDLGSTFNYAEMAALIAPRPFMVERGHFDGVADDWTVAYEYAKVRHLYAARLKIPERTEIEWFDGPHKIHGKGTFDFLHRHLKWRSPESQSADTAQ
jgi:predicted alpha/beta-fold hydrolase